MNDKDFINGFESGITLVKAIFALPTYERETIFGTVNVATILDRFDFAELYERMSQIT